MGLVKNSLKTSALVWLLVAAAAPAIARDAGLVPDAPLMKPHRTFWDLAQFTWVRLKPQEKGAAPNDAQVRVDGDALQSRLAPVRLASPDGDEPLFGKDELKILQGALAEALTVADPAEDLILFSSSRRAQGYLSSPLAVAARLFVKNGALNLIVQESRMEVLGRYSPDSDLSKIEFGSRVRASTVSSSSRAKVAMRSSASFCMVMSRVTLTYPFRPPWASRRAVITTLAMKRVPSLRRRQPSSW